MNHTARPRQKMSLLDYNLLVSKIIFYSYNIFKHLYINLSFSCVNHTKHELLVVNGLQLGYLNYQVFWPQIRPTCIGICNLLHILSLGRRLATSQAILIFRTADLKKSRIIIIYFMLHYINIYINKNQSLFSRIFTPQ